MTHKPISKRLRHALQKLAIGRRLIAEAEKELRMLTKEAK